MKKIALFLVLFSIILLDLGAQDMAVATVRYKKTEPVSGRQLNETIELLEQQQGRKLTEEERKDILEKMIDQILVLQAAEADRTITVTDAEVETAGIRLISQQLMVQGALPEGAVLTDKVQYKQIVESQGITLKEYEDTIRKQLLTEKYITSSNKDVFQSIGSASEAEINAEYQRRTAEFAISDSVWFNHIFFNTMNATPQEIQEKQSKAQDVYRQLVNTSTTFADLVASESEDEVSKARGGQIGPLMLGDPTAEQLYGTDFIDSVFALRVKDTSKVLKSNVGYHILQITEKKAAQLLPKEDPEVRSYLEQIIYARKFQNELLTISNAIVSELRSKSTINYFGEYR